MIIRSDLHHIASKIDLYHDKENGITVPRMVTFELGCRPNAPVFRFDALQLGCVKSDAQFKCGPLAILTLLATHAAQSAPKKIPAGHVLRRLFPYQADIIEPHLEIGSFPADSWFVAKLALLEINRPRANPVERSSRLTEAIAWTPTSADWPYTARGPVI
ncbi:MAG TPA: hypothetical protein VGC40_09135 [Paenirhodobacter sp.]